jgi:hypothetical protein
MIIIIDYMLAALAIWLLMFTDTTFLELATVAIVIIGVWSMFAGLLGRG